MVSKENNFLLLQPVQDHEIKAVIIQIDKLKTPGPDGFGAAFFQDHWHLIAPDVCQAIRSFFQDDKMLK